MVCTMSGDPSSDFGTATEEETDDQSIRLSDVGLSDTEPVEFDANLLGRGSLAGEKIEALGQSEPVGRELGYALVVLCEAHL